MEMKHVKGDNKGKVVLYALSTCVWCKKTKKLLKDLGVEYYYIDVDVLEGKERDQVIEQLKKFNPKCSFPTVVIDDDTCIIGYDERKLKEELK
ncbi:MAG: glutaredoxin family protein [Candidatus Methanofastidiosia archaeon]|jgi:glutaredoxin